MPINVQDAAALALPAIVDLARMPSDRAWERVHEVFYASGPEDTDGRLIGLVMARWVLGNLPAPRHHLGAQAIVSVLCAIRRDHGLAAIWDSDRISVVMADIAAVRNRQQQQEEEV